MKNSISYTMCVVLIRTAGTLSWEDVNSYLRKLLASSEKNEIIFFLEFWKEYFFTEQTVLLRTNIFPRKNTNSPYKDYTNGVPNKDLPLYTFLAMQTYKEHLNFWKYIYIKYTWSVKRNLLLQSDIQWNPLHQKDSYLTQLR